MFFHRGLAGLLVVGVAFFLLVGTCFAQAPSVLGTTMPKMGGRFKIDKVGSYAEYNLVSQASQSQELLKLSIVGEEKRPEGRLWWYETRRDNRNGGGTTIVKMLISGDPGQTGNIKRVIIKYNQEKAMELPSGFFGAGPVKKKPTESAQGRKEEPKRLGREKIKTPVGTFDCVHLLYRQDSTNTVEAWTSEKIPILGLAKLKSKDETLELLNYGKNATSAITEEPDQILQAGGQTDEK